MGGGFDPAYYGSAEGREDLFDLGPRDFAFEQLRLIRQQGLLLDRQLSSLVVEGQWHSNNYWDEVGHLLEEDSSWLCCVGTRVRLNHGAFSAEWYRNRFVRQGDGQSRVYSSYIKKGRSLHYSMSSFRGKHDGPFREIIEITERRYRVLRERAALIVSQRRSLRSQERLVLVNLSDSVRLEVLNDLSKLTPEGSIDD